MTPSPARENLRLAAIGFPVAESFHPLFGGEIDVPSYIAFQETPLQTFWPVVMLCIATSEVRALPRHRLFVPLTRTPLWMIVRTGLLGLLLRLTVWRRAVDDLLRP